LDWGSGAWYLSSAYGQFTTNSTSFNGPSLTSASVTFVTPRLLTQLDAYNGGTTSTFVSLTCGAVTTPSVQLLANQRATILTNFTATCTTLTIRSTNGWDTNFDNLVLQ